MKSFIVFAVVVSFLFAGVAVAFTPSQLDASQAIGFNGILSIIVIAYAYCNCFILRQA